MCFPAASSMPTTPPWSWHPPRPAARHLHANLNEPDTHSATAAGLYVAALREALEECGLLLAEPLGGHLHW
jgi:hypothetical protein